MYYCMRHRRSFEAKPRVESQKPLNTKLFSGSTIIIFYNVFVRLEEAIHSLPSVWA